MMKCVPSKNWFLLCVFIFVESVIMDFKNFFNDDDLSDDNKSSDLSFIPSSVEDISSVSVSMKKIILFFK